MRKAAIPTTNTKLSRENVTSLYEQIAARLQEEMEAGLYEPSGRLPSESEIGQRFQVSRVTVRLALDKLVQEGAVVRKQGKGSYAAGRQVRHGLDTLRSFHESLKLQGLKATMQLIDKKLITLPNEVRQRFAPAAKGLFLQRLHLVDDEPVALGESYLPYKLHTYSWQEIEHQPAYSLLAERMGEAPARADIAIRAQSADERLAALLKVSIGDALLVMRRTSYFARGACCDYTHFYVRPERYEFVMSSTFREPIQANTTAAHA